MENAGKSNAYCQTSPEEHPPLPTVVLKEQLKAMDVFSPEFDESMIQALMVPVVASLQTDSLVQRIAFTEMEDLLRRQLIRFTDDIGAACPMTVSTLLDQPEASPKKKLGKDMLSSSTSKAAAIKSPKAAPRNVPK
jgi:hypothetical protein